MIEPTDEMRRALRSAADGACLCNVCANHRVAAVLAIVERDYIDVDGVHRYGRICRPGNRCVYCGNGYTP